MPDTGMIAFLPADGSWCKQDFPHMSLVITGPIDDLPETQFNEMGKDTISVARLTRTFSLNVTGVEEWGVTERVDVLTLFPTPQLLVARQITERWDIGDFKEFKPHATIGPAGSAAALDVPVNTNMFDSPRRGRSTLPSSIWFDRIAACWGDKKLVFALDDFA